MNVLFLSVPKLSSFFLLRSCRYPHARRVFCVFLQAASAMLSAYFGSASICNNLFRLPEEKRIVVGLKFSFPVRVRECMRTSHPFLLLPVFYEKTERVLQNFVGPQQFCIFFPEPLIFCLLFFFCHQDFRLLRLSCPLLSPVSKCSIDHAELFRRLFYADII